MTANSTISPETGSRGDSEVRLWLERLPPEATVAQFQAFLRRSGAMLLTVDVLPDLTGTPSVIAAVAVGADGGSPKHVTPAAFRALMATLRDRLMIRTTSVAGGDLLTSLTAKALLPVPQDARRELWLVLGESDTEDARSQMLGADRAEGEWCLAWVRDDPRGLAVRLAARDRSGSVR